jgi:hypothetical protein
MPTVSRWCANPILNICLNIEHLSAMVLSPTSRCTDLGATVSQVHTPTAGAPEKSTTDVASLVAGLLGESLEQADRDTVNATLRAVHAVRTWLDAVEIRAARRVRQLHDAGRADSPVTTLIDNNGCSGRDARNTLDREGSAPTCPCSRRHSVEAASVALTSTR